MKIEEQLCGLELALKLESLGVKQDAFYSHVADIDDWSNIVTDLSECGNSDCLKVSAFSVAELGEMLPHFLHYCLQGHWQDFYLTQRKFLGDYVVEYTNKHKIYGDARDKSEANARAKMLIYLIENKNLDNFKPVE